MERQLGGLFDLSISHIFCNLDMICENIRAKMEPPALVALFTAEPPQGLVYKCMFLVFP